MKIKVTFKDPDALYNCLEQQVKGSIPAELSQSERDLILESRVESVKDVIVGRWLEYGEYLEVEFDTVALTAKVIGKEDK